MWNAVSHMQHLDKITRFFFFPFWYRLTFLFSISKNTSHLQELVLSNWGLFGQSDCTFLIPAKQRIRKKINLSPDCEWTDWDRTWGRGWRPSCSWVWAGGAACVGQPAAGRGTPLVGPSSPSPHRALTGGLQCNTKNSAVPCFQSIVSGRDSEPSNSPKREVELLYLALKLKFRISGKDSEPRYSPKREAELLYQTFKLKFSLWERFKAQEQSKEGGGAAVPGFKAKVQNLRERLRAQVQSEEGGGAAVPDLQTKVQSLGKIQSSGTVRRGRWSCCTRL